MKDFSQLKKNLKRDFSGLKTIRVAILGDTSTQFLAQSLRGLGYDNNLNLNTLNIFSVIVASVSIWIIFYMRNHYPKIPGPIVVVVFSGLFVWFFNIPIDTIESRFGQIPSMLPTPSFPEITFEKIRLN